METLLKLLGKISSRFVRGHIKIDAVLGQVDNFVAELEKGEAQVKAAVAKKLDNAATLVAEARKLEAEAKDIASKLTAKAERSARARARIIEVLG